ncbi:MAG: zinc-dependent peptidase [Steroidobacteraceae bacterium]
MSSRSDAESWRRPMRTAGGALLWSVPMAIVAFLLFPRVQGGLWGLPGADQAQTGLGDEMSPGSISELSVSDDPAFRVHFTGTVPAPRDRYWRGPVLHEFDGYTWRRGFVGVPRENTQRLGDPVAYRVTLQPTGRNWWYALDTIDAPPSRRVVLTHDHQLVATLPVTQVTSYEATSHVATRSTDALPVSTRRIETRLPASRNPRTLALARELRAAHADVPSLVEAVLDRFRREGFEYTLTPPLLDYDSVDDFLFNTRLGFCGHYASAFVTLMRAAGVPSRVVTGYQGGEWNALGGYLLVRQSDAHAWAEVWIDGTGWQRVDPTAAAAPERLTRGFRELQPSSGDLTARLLRGNRWLGELFRSWDAANTWWQTRVLEFDRGAQLGLLARLGLPDADYPLLAALLMAAAALWAGAFALRRHLAERPRRDDVGRSWQRLRRAVARAGLAPPAHLAAAGFAGEATQRFPELAPLFQSALRIHDELRYAPVTRARSADLLIVVQRLERRLARREEELRAPTLAADELHALETGLPLYHAVPPALRERTARLARALLDQVPLVGCGGLVIDAKMRALIAFQACLLVCTRDLSLYRPLRSVLVYPDEFVVTERHEDEHGVVTEEERPLSGQSEDDSRILLSWRDVLDGVERGDGYNVVLHEFAHLLDHLSGGELSARGDDPARASLARSFDDLCAAVDRGEDTLIDPYGAEDPAEFFAVCTELFFEIPWDLRDAHGDVYAALARFYGLDPASWD